MSQEIGQEPGVFKLKSQETLGLGPAHADQDYHWISGQSEHLGRADEDEDNPKSEVLEEVVIVFLRGRLA